MSRILLAPTLIGMLAVAPLVPTSARAQDDDAQSNDTARTNDTARSSDDARELDEEIEAFDRTPRDCVLLNRIRGTEVIDNRTILFRMRGGDILRNHLPNECPNLEREDQFAYRARTRQLCQIDTITVIERSIGATGATCRLGPFHPILPEEVQELKDGPSGVDVTPVEAPAEEPSSREE